MAIIKYKDPSTGGFRTLDLPIGQHFYSTNEQVIGTWLNDDTILYEIVSKTAPAGVNILSTKQMGEYTVYQYTKN